MQKEQFITYNDMMAKIIRKPTRIEKTNEIMSEQVISWVKR